MDAFTSTRLKTPADRQIEETELNRERHLHTASAGHPSLLTLFMTDSPPKVTTYDVYGYQHCSYASTAAARVQAIAQAHPATVKANTKITSRSEYKEWLRNNKNVPSHHTSSPACFENQTFIGGCDEICAHLDRTYPNEKSSEAGVCAVQ